MTLSIRYSNMSNQTKSTHTRPHNYHHLYGDRFNYGGYTPVDKQDTKDLETLLNEAIPNAEITRIFSNKLLIDYKNGNERLLIIIGKLVFVGDKNENLEEVRLRV